MEIKLILTKTDFAVIKKMCNMLFNKIDIVFSSETTWRKQPLRQKSKFYI